MLLKFKLRVAEITHTRTIAHTLNLEAMVSIHCPNCGVKISVEAKVRWNTAYCKHCKTDLVVHLSNDHIYVKYDTSIAQVAQ